MIEGHNGFSQVQRQLRGEPPVFVQNRARAVVMPGLDRMGRSGRRGKDNETHPETSEYYNRMLRQMREDGLPLEVQADALQISAFLNNGGVLPPEHKLSQSERIALKFLANFRKNYSPLHLQGAPLSDSDEDDTDTKEDDLPDWVSSENVTSTQWYNFIHNQDDD